MNKPKSNILVITEGVTDKKLTERLLKVYGIDEKFSFFSYGTNLYPLFNSISKEQDRDDWDILLFLRSREKDIKKKEILNLHFAEVIMIFDFDPHDPQFDADKITTLVEFFSDSTEAGKLYINYPMVESFYHMKNIPDDFFNSYVVAVSDIGSFKARVQKNFQPDPSKFAVRKDEVDIVIRQNINKARLISDMSIRNENKPPDSLRILMAQLEKVNDERAVAVLCTSIFYIVDYNSNLIGMR